MNFKGRTVIAFVFLSMFASCIVTLTFVGASGQSILTNESTKTSQDKVEQLLTQQDITKMNTVMGIIKNKFVTETDHQKVLDGALTGMMNALGDPHTVYIDKESAKSYEENLAQQISGIGADVALKDNRVTIISPYKGSPAERAGLRPGDTIVSVNGEKLDGLKLTDAVQKIRGPKGTQAKLQVIREGSAEPIEVIVVRDEISVETVYGTMLQDNIGKIEITQFASNTGARFREELKKLEGQGMKGLIIDVRSNPGGFLNVVEDMADAILTKGKTIVQVDSRTNGRTKSVSKGTGKPYPIVALINKGSASASEILSAAIHESGGGVLIGETSYGKGSVQENVPLPDGSIAKLTIAKWLTPNGNWIDQKGIEPDIKVSQPAFFAVAPLPEDKTLKLDMYGEDVRNLQLMLQGIELDPGRTDGYFNAKTQEAARAFQTKAGLPATGEVDKATADKLQAAVVQSIRDPKNDAQLKAAVEQVQKMLSK